MEKMLIKNDNRWYKLEKEVWSLEINSKLKQKIKCKK